MRAAVPVPEGYLVAGQAYDVRVELRMPRAPRNLEAGNFMLDLQLLGPAAPTTSSSGEEQAAPIARERRPASLTWRSAPVELAYKAVGLPLYVVGWWREEERVGVSLMEGVTFAARGRRAVLPTDVRIDILTDARLQIYSAEVSFRTRLRGLR
jgi:seipin